VKTYIKRMYIEGALFHTGKWQLGTHKLNKLVAHNTCGMYRLESFRASRDHVTSEGGIWVT